MIKVEKELLYKLKPFFKDIRFYMGNTVLDGMFGEAYTNDINNPRFAILLTRKFLFVSGKIEKEELKNILDNYKEYKLIASDDLGVLIQQIYKDKIIKKERYSLKKNPKFDLIKLNQIVNCLPNKYSIFKIDVKIANRIKKEEFLSITNDYARLGIGYCVIYNNEIIGVASSSSIIYNDGIEVNIKVKEEYRRQGIASALAAKLILECIKQNRKISWDAANLNSLGLAEKLGFEYDSTYNTYSIISDLSKGVNV